MRKSIFAIALLLVGAGCAFGIIEGGATFPNSWLYDGLITYDHMGVPPTPNAFHVNAGIGYMTAGEYYDHDGEARDMEGDGTFITVPIDIGYAINENILLDVTLQFLSSTISDDSGFGEDYSAAGLGDVWVKGRYIAPVGGFNLGARLGVKVPVGKVDYEDDKPELGDGQMDIDVAAVAGMCPDRGFAFNGQLGYRHRMAEEVTLAAPEEGESYDVKFTPGNLIYLHLEPGYTMGSDNFSVYMPVGYMTSGGTKAEVEGETNNIDDSETSGLYLGLAPKYGIDANNTVGVKFLYPIMGTGGGIEAGPYLLKTMSIGVTYEGYLPI
ncbi:MAG: transporter [Candidatus Zixiibacteriota bacterium]|jgi:hypothetical protein